MSMISQQLMQALVAVLGMFFFVGIWWAVQLVSLHFQAKNRTFSGNNQLPEFSSTCGGCSMNKVGCAAGKSAGDRDNSPQTGTQEKIGENLRLA
ncbi:MAG: hypothetical protein OEZ59_10830 [Deltaproteobacteria bacterium]|nr:hypothetical protein [Deltaproteobacteria bacterium]